MVFDGLQEKDIDVNILLFFLNSKSHILLYLVLTDSKKI